MEPDEEYHSVFDYLFDLFIEPRPPTTIVSKGLSVVFIIAFFVVAFFVEKSDTLFKNVFVNKFVNFLWKIIIPPKLSWYETQKRRGVLLKRDKQFSRHLKLVPSDIIIYRILRFLPPIKYSNCCRKTGKFCQDGVVRYVFPCLIISSQFFWRKSNQFLVNVVSLELNECCILIYSRIPLMHKLKYLKLLGDSSINVCKLISKTRQLKKLSLCDYVFFRGLCVLSEFGPTKNTEKEICAKLNKLDTFIFDNWFSDGIKKWLDQMNNLKMLILHGSWGNVVNKLDFPTNLEELALLGTNDMVNIQINKMNKINVLKKLKRLRLYGYEINGSIGTVINLEHLWAEYCLLNLDVKLFRTIEIMIIKQSGIDWVNPHKDSFGINNPLDNSVNFIFAYGERFDIIDAPNMSVKSMYDLKDRGSCDKTNFPKYMNQQLDNIKLVRKSKAIKLKM